MSHFTFHFLIVFIFVAKRICGNSTEWSWWELLFFFLKKLYFFIRNFHCEKACRVRAVLTRNNNLNISPSGSSNFQLFNEIQNTNWMKKLQKNWENKMSNWIKLQKEEKIDKDSDWIYALSVVTKIVLSPAALAAATLACAAAISATKVSTFFSNPSPTT